MRTFFRRTVRDLLHNGVDRVIANSSDAEYDFDTLLQHSRFNLILPGDIEFSYRFAEAVCSGGVPVMIGAHWVPPFDEFVRFESYGVYIQKDLLHTILPILEAKTDTQVQQ